MAKQKIFIFALFFVLYEMTVCLSNDMIMPAMLGIAQQFKAPSTVVGSSLSFHIFGGSLLQLFLAPLADRIGKRKVMLAGNILFLIATLVAPFSTNISMFLLACFLQGVGLSFIFIGYAMIHEYLDDKEAVKFISLISNVSLIAPLAGPLVGASIMRVASWEYIFIISGILGLISLTGLWKVMPQGNITLKKLELRKILLCYKSIVTNPTYFLGITTACFGIIPIFTWVGLSPVFIMQTMKAPLSTYLIDQSIIFSGLVASSLFIQKFAGRLSFFTLIMVGSQLSFLGLLIAFFFSFDRIALVGGMFLYAWGMGLSNGSIIRISLMATGQSSGFGSSFMSFYNCLFFAISLEVFNLICNHLGYTLGVYTTLNLFMAGIPMVVGALIFALRNKNRVWEKRDSERMPPSL